MAYDLKGGVIKLSDVAEIQDTKKDITLVNRIDLQNSIGISIQKQSDANAVSVSELVTKELAKIEAMYADQDLKFAVAQDSSKIYARRRRCSYSRPYTGGRFGCCDHAAVPAFLAGIRSSL